MSASEKLAELESRVAKARIQHWAAQAALVADDAVRASNAEALVLDLPQVASQLTELERSDLANRIAACERIMTFADAQRPSLQANIESEVLATRRDQSRRIRAEMVPDLRAAARVAGAAFGVALASLAAAEDKALSLQNRPDHPEGHGNASALIVAMSNTRGENIFCETGAGRGPWDWAGYREQTTRVEEFLRGPAA